MSSTDKSTTKNEEILIIKDELTISETQVETEAFNIETVQLEINEQELLNINEDNNDSYIVIPKDEESEMPSAILPDLQHPEYNAKTIQINPSQIHQINSNRSNVEGVIDPFKINGTGSNESNVKCVYQFLPLNNPIIINGLRVNLVKELNTDNKDQPVVLINQPVISNSNNITQNVNPQNKNQPISTTNNNIKQTINSQNINQPNSNTSNNIKERTNPPVHSPTESYKCGLCNLRFERAIDRNNHIVSHSVASTYKCKCCQKDFSYFTVLLNHLNFDQCYNSFPVYCFYCKHTSLSLLGLIAHHKLEMKKCRWCGIKICGREVYDAHIPICRYRRGSIRKVESTEIIDLTGGERKMKTIEKRVKKRL